MAKYFDADGNEIETLSPEEANQIKAQAEKAAELEQEAREAKQKIEEIEQKENKKKYDYENLRRNLEEKDKIIENLRKDDTSESDKKLLEEKLAEANKTIEKYTEIEQRFALDEKRREDEKRQRVEKRREDRFSQITDEDLRKKIEAEYQIYNIDDTTEEGFNERFDRAYSRVVGSRPPSYKPSIGSVGGGFDPSDHGEKEFVKTDKGQQAYNNMFPQIAKIKEAKKAANNS